MNLNTTRSGVPLPEGMGQAMQDARVRAKAIGKLQSRARKAVTAAEREEAQVELRVLVAGYEAEDAVALAAMAQ